MGTTRRRPVIITSHKRGDYITASIHLQGFGLPSRGFF
jgi:hypothetical protein